MKKYVWLVTCVLLISSLCWAAPEGSYLLRYSSQNSLLKYRNELKFSFAFYPPKGVEVEPIKAAMEFKYDSMEQWKITEAKTLSCRTTVSKLELKYNFLNQKNTLKIDNFPEDTAVEVYLSPQGKVVDVILTNPQPENGEAAKAKPEQVKAMVLTMYDLMYYFLPDREVTKGDTWEKKYKIPGLAPGNEEEALLPVSYAMTKVQKSRGKFLATIVSNGEKLYEAVFDQKMFEQEVEVETEDQTEGEVETNPDDGSDVPLTSAFEKIEIKIPLQWAGKIVFAINDGYIKAREFELKGNGLVNFINNNEKIPFRVVIAVEYNMKQI